MTPTVGTSSLERRMLSKTNLISVPLPARFDRLDTLTHVSSAVYEGTDFKRAN